jgi:hypothetical protein
MLEDITDRKNKEAALAATTTMLRELQYISKLKL